AKQRLGARRPRLIWKFVVFKHNEHEVETLERAYRELGFDDYELVRDYGSPSAMLALRKHNADLLQKKKGCYWAWHTTVIRADGEVLPCCKEQGAFRLGNV